MYKRRTFGCRDSFLFVSRAVRGLHRLDLGRKWLKERRSLHQAKHGNCRDKLSHLKISTSHYTGGRFNVFLLIQLLHAVPECHLLSGSGLTSTVYLYILLHSGWQLNPDSAFFHFCILYHNNC